MFKLLIYLIIGFGFANCEVRSTLPEKKYCSHLVKCGPNECCLRFGGSIFGGMGRCAPLRLEGQACDLGCPCSPGFVCSVNPLCPKCRTICMKNEVVSALSFYFNDACLGNCKDSMLNHLFKPRKCDLKSYRQEGQSCNEWCKCISGTYCAPNILCKHCDNICMSMDVVNSLVHYFNVGCLNCRTDESPVVFSRINTRFNRIEFDANGVVLFPNFF